MSGKNRTGRPLKQHPEGTQVTITLQVPAELKLRLQEKALNCNRSLSQEAERRLARSFSVRALQEDVMALLLEETHSRIEADLAARRAEIETKQRKILADLTARQAQLAAELDAQMMREIESMPKPQREIVEDVIRLRARLRSLQKGCGPDE